MIKATGLTKKFGLFVAVENLTLDIPEGEIFGFLGPNGAGKTTTIRMLCGLIEPSSGDASINSYDLKTNPAGVRSSVGLLTEQPGLYEQLNAWDNLLFYAELYQLSAQEGKRRVQETLEWLGLWGVRRESVGGFSKGMKQRLAIGRCLLHRPKVLFLDEPTSALDAESAQTVREAILTLKNTRRTIFLSTHNLDEANRLCDRIGIFKQHLLKIDTPLNLRREGGLDADSRQVQVHLLQPVPDTLTETINALPFVVRSELVVQPIEAAKDGGVLLVVWLKEPEKHNPALLRALIEAGAEVQFVEEQTASLEDVYLKLIK
jgi:ABC-2 type transport system ATP-binding protein